MTTATIGHQIRRFISFFNRIEAIKRFPMMDIKSSIELNFCQPTKLASVSISCPNFLTDFFPLFASKIGCPTLPVRMLIISIFFATKRIIALPRAEMMFGIFSCLSTCEANRFTTGLTRYNRYIRVVIVYVAEVVRACFGKMNSITGSRATSSNFGLSPIGDIFFSTEFTYQLSHNAIIPQHLPLNKGEDYRPLKKT